MENSKKIVIAAALLALGFVFAGGLLRNGIIRFKESERVVSVKGLSEKEVKADRVIWPLMYKVAGNNLSDLYNTIETSNAKIVSFLKTNGISEEEITISPAQVIDMDAERYVSEGVKYRYNVTSILTVSTDKVDQVVKLMAQQGDLLRQGIAINNDGDYRYQTQFLYTSNSLNQIKPTMIEEATQNARIAAEKFAHCPLRAQLVKMPVNGRLPDGFARLLQQTIQLLRRQMPPAVLAQQALYGFALLGFVHHSSTTFLQQMKMKTIFIFCQKSIRENAAGVKKKWFGGSNSTENI